MGTDGWSAHAGIRCRVDAGFHSALTPCQSTDASDLGRFIRRACLSPSESHGDHYYTECKVIEVQAAFRSAEKRNANTVTLCQSCPPLPPPCHERQGIMKPSKHSPPRRPTFDGSKAYKRIIERVARDCPYPSDLVALVVARFFEFAVDELCSAQIVRIPGFGDFGTKSYRPKEGYPQAAVVFCASRGLRKEVQTRVIGNNTTEDHFRKIRKRNRNGNYPKRPWERATRTLRIVGDRSIIFNDGIPETD